ncbi:hypothetical protein LTR64_003676 [Lithohypha guttulata]|uniref:uncharacterized protein n=1 Tax=Lithohypha guttulata TaxID=1690604 RepID=UPI002DE083B6|nr:hypothetical protein LTR51_000103 [Lithohypha guttulata]
MAKKKRQRISYVLPLASRPGGHRLGINGLAIDHDRNILYTGGRDGVICAWDLDLDAQVQQQEDTSLPKRRTTASFRREVQAHTHWVNDLVLVKNNLALVSASSDSSVKLWRPHSHDTLAAYSIGSHSDYVKCLTTPETNSNWVASGGLDSRICLWDLAGKGQKLEINVKKDANVVKGSIYALKAKGNVIASGGPEGVVRLWDINSGKTVTKLVGHTDNIRDILISENGDAVLTASSDQTIKVWSITAGRCMHTLTMHNDSVWCMYSEDPSLSIFYSGDKSGLVAKTDTRHADDIDDGVSVAVCQEHDGINRLAIAGDSVWTTTSSSSVNRWQDVDTELEIETPPVSPKHERNQSSRGLREQSSPEPTTNGTQDHPTTNGETPKKIPYNAILRLTNTAIHPGNKSFRHINISTSNLRKASEAIIEVDGIFTTPIRGHPEETIEGQNGLVKHHMLNDKKRVLTSDAAGEVVLWDLLKCVPIQSFGRRHLDEVIPDVNTAESVSNWCTVDTKTGKLTVMLEELYCFDAEVYADETEFVGKIEFREDQRINLGKWVLRNLFTTLLDEEIRRDEDYRKSIKKPTGLKRGNAPSGITMPPSNPVSIVGTPDDMTTPKADVNASMAPKTPGMKIGMATPLAKGKPMAETAKTLPPTAEDERELTENDSRSSMQSSSEQSHDYFSQTKAVPADSSEAQAHKEIPPTPGGTVHVPMPQSPNTEKKKSGIFGKSFNMKMSFPNKLALARTNTESPKTSVDDKKEEDKKSEEDRSDKSSEKEDDKTARILDDNFYGVVQRIRYAYGDHLENISTSDQPIPIGITPSPPNETPVLKPPPHTLILIQEDNPEAGGLSDLYRGEIASLGYPKETDVLEKVAPTWLGELLLRNEMPPKDAPKVSFILTPAPDSKLPGIASSDGNARLNANRMLRSKKILGYVVERIEAPPDPDNPQPGDELRPEEYMDLLCQGQVVPPNMTLATLRVHMWRTGGDVILHYRENGRKGFKRAHPMDVPLKTEGAGELVNSANDTNGHSSTAATTEAQKPAQPPAPTATAAAYTTAAMMR